MPTRYRGFTFVELLVVVALISMTTAYLVPKFANFGSKQRLNEIAEKLQSDLRSAQNNAVSGVQCRDGNGTIISTNSGGWTVRFVKESENYAYKIYQNCPDLLAKVASLGTPIPTPVLSYTLLGVSAINITTNTCAQQEDKINLDTTNFLGQQIYTDITFEGFSGQAVFDSNDTTAVCPVSNAPTLRQMAIELQMSGEPASKKLIIETGGSIYVKSE